MTLNIFVIQYSWPLAHIPLDPTNQQEFSIFDYVQTYKDNETWRWVSSDAPLVFPSDDSENESKISFHLSADITLCKTSASMQSVDRVELAQFDSPRGHPHHFLCATLYSI